MSDEVGQGQLEAEAQLDEAAPKAGAATEPSEDPLLRAILGLLDERSEPGLKRLLSRRITTPTTSFNVRGVYAVLDAVDEVYPGLLDYYATIRSEGVPR